VKQAATKDQAFIADCRLLITDCRLKKWCGSFVACQSVPPSGINRKSAIQAILGQTTISVSSSVLLSHPNGGVFVSSRGEFSHGC
jgi:hypothetical protein